MKKDTSNLGKTRDPIDQVRALLAQMEQAAAQQRATNNTSKKKDFSLADVQCWYKKGQYQLVQLGILGRYAKLEQVIEGEDLQLILAIQKGDIATFIQLEPEDPNYIINGSPYSLLSIAICANQNDIVSILCKRGANIAAELCKRYSPSKLAIEFDNTIALKILFEHGLVVDARVGESNDTLLIHAIALQKTDIMRLLIERGADLNAQNDQGATPIQKALANEDNTTAYELIPKGARIGPHNKDKFRVFPLGAVDLLGVMSVEMVISCREQVLMFCYREGYEEFAIELCQVALSEGVKTNYNFQIAADHKRYKFLLWAKSNPIVTDEFQLLSKVEKELGIAIEKDDTTAIDKILLDQKITYENLGPFFNPLIYAASRGHLSAAKNLFYKGMRIQIDDTISTRCASLYIQLLMSQKNEQEAIRFVDKSNLDSSQISGTAMVARKSDCPNYIDHLLKTNRLTLAMCCESGEQELIKRAELGDLSYYTSLAYRFGKERIYNIVNFQSLGFLPLYVAIKNKHDSLRNFFFAHGVRCPEKSLCSRLIFKEMIASNRAEQYFELVEKGYLTFNSAEQLPLHLAAETGAIQSVKYLIEKRKMPIDQPGLENNSPLQTAILSGQQEAVRFLVRNGADVTHVNQENKSVIRLACESGHADLAWVLIATYKERCNDKAILFTTLIEDIVFWDVKSCPGVRSHSFARLIKVTPQEYIDLVLDCMSDINRSYDKIPLVVAIRESNTNWVEKLISRGANTNLIMTEAYSHKQKLSLALTLVKIVKQPIINLHELLLPIETFDWLTTDQRLDLLKTLFLLRSVDALKQCVYKKLLPIDEIIDDTGTLLHHAIQIEALELVEVLLKMKANPNIRNADKQKPMHFAIKAINSMILCQMLVEANASFSFVKSKDCEPLIKTALLTNNFSVFEFLLISGATLDDLKVSELSVEQTDQVTIVCQRESTRREIIRCVGDLLKEIDSNCMVSWSIEGSPDCHSLYSSKPLIISIACKSPLVLENLRQSFLHFEISTDQSVDNKAILLNEQNALLIKRQGALIIAEYQTLSKLKVSAVQKKKATPNTTLPSSSGSTSEVVRLSKFTQDDRIREMVLCRRPWESRAVFWNTESASAPIKKSLTRFRAEMQSVLGANYSDEIADRIYAQQYYDPETADGYTRNLCGRYHQEIILRNKESAIEHKSSNQNSLISSAPEDQLVQYRKQELVPALSRKHKIRRVLPLSLSVVKNEYFFMSGLHSWYQSIQKQEPIFDKIYYRCMWVSMLRTYNAIFRSFWSQKNSASTADTFSVTINDHDAGVIRNTIVHGFLSCRALQENYQQVICQLSERVLAYEKSSGEFDGPSCDLSKCALFTAEPFNVDYVDLICELIGDIDVITQRLINKEQFQSAVYKLTAIQTTITLSCEALDIWIHHARALEGCILLLGELASVYLLNKRAGDLSDRVVKFLDTCKAIRNVGTHEQIADDQWNHDPIKPGLIIDMCVEAREILKEGLRTKDAKLHSL